MMIKINNQSGDRFDRIRPRQVLRKAVNQIKSNIKLRSWFNDILINRDKTIDDILTGDLDVSVYILKRGDGLLDSTEQVRWDGVFRGRWNGQPDRSIALASGLFDPDFFDTDKGDRREAATLLIHGLAHWVEAYALNAIWPDRPNGYYDTGDFVESLIKW